MGGMRVFRLLSQTSELDLYYSYEAYLTVIINKSRLFVLNTI